MAVTAPRALDLASFISFFLCPKRPGSLQYLGSWDRVLMWPGEALGALVGLILSSLSRAFSELLPLAQGCPGMCPPAAVPGVGPERWPRGTC